MNPFSFRPTIYLLCALSALGAACEAEPAEAVDDGGSRVTGDATTWCEAPAPPAVVMQSDAGVQIGASADSCVSNVALACRACAYRNAAPDHYTYVRPGDEVVFSMERGNLVSEEGCESQCGPVLSVRLHSCSESFEDQLVLAEDRPWKVRLPPGLYWLWLDSRFEGSDGWKGNLGVRFGLVVDATRERKVVEGPINISCVGAPAAD